MHTAEGMGVRQAMQHLVELGHRRIVHIDGGRGPGSAERRRAYRAAMRGHGLQAEQRAITGDHTERAGIEAGRLLLAERDAGTPLPTAVLAGNDRSAMGLLMALTRGGVEVPRDLSVVGYDDSHLSHLMPIGLTTVRQPAGRTRRPLRRAAPGEPRTGAQGSRVGPEARRTRHDRPAAGLQRSLTGPSGSG